MWIKFRIELLIPGFASYHQASSKANSVLRRFQLLLEAMGISMVIEEVESK